MKYLLASEDIQNEIVRVLSTLSASDIIQLREKGINTLHAPVENFSLNGVERIGNTVVVPITGMITYKHNFLSFLFGGTSVEVLLKTIRQIDADESISNVILNFDTNGGSVEGLDEAATAIRSLRETKNVVSIANMKALSAGYYLASAADAVIVSSSSTVGSIGTIAVLIDQSEMLDKMGVKPIIIREGEFKARPHPLEKMSDEDIELIEERVKYYNDKFISALSKNRNITMSEAKKMADGKVLTAEEAIENGLADAFGSLDDVLASFEEAENQKAEFRTFAESAFARLDALTSDLETKNAALTAKNTVIEDLNTKIEDLRADMEKTKIEAVVNDAVEDGRIPSQKAEKYIEMAKDKGITFVSAIFENLPVGQFMPSETLEVNGAEANDDPDAPITAEEKEIYRQIPSLREKYNL